MYKFKDSKNISSMCFVKAHCNGEVVRMYATADVKDAIKKLMEYRKQGFIVSYSLKPIKVITSDGYTFELK